jgi:hypothetical protein
LALAFSAKAAAGFFLPLGAASPGLVPVVAAVFKDSAEAAVGAPEGGADVSSAVDAFIASVVVGLVADSDSNVAGVFGIGSAAASEAGAGGSSPFTGAGGVDAGRLVIGIAAVEYASSVVRFASGVGFFLSSGEGFSSLLTASAFDRRTETTPVVY